MFIALHCIAWCDVLSCLVCEDQITVEGKGMEGEALQGDRESKVQGMLPAMPPASTRADTCTSAHAKQVRATTTTHEI